MAQAKINSRRKGKTGELEVAGILREQGFDSRRGVQYKGGPDSPDVTGVPGFHLEVKRTNKLNLYAALHQSERDAASTEVPVVIHRRDREKWVAILNLQDFIDLYKKAYGNPEDNDAEANQEAE